MSNIRNLTLTAAGYKTRAEQFEGRDHLVVPVIALVEGVVRALNSNGPEYVKPERFLKQPLGWSGRPVFHGHPMRNGKPVSGNLPEVLAKQRVGTVFNPTGVDNKLKMEAWIDVERCGAVAPALLSRVKAGEPVEISIGAFVETEDVDGTFNNRRYAAAWTDIVPDHLALLPEGDEGACSRKMGCGVRAASAVPTEFDEEPSDLAGNGSNQYASKGSAASHEAAANAAEAAATAHDTAAKNPTYETSKAAFTASVAANNASIAAGVKGVSRIRTYTPSRGDVHTSAQHTSQAETERANAEWHRGEAAKAAKAGRYATQGDMNMYSEWLEDEAPIGLLRALRNIPQEERDKLPKEDFAGPNESFPIAEPVDVHDAAQALGRAKGDRASIKRKIIGIAYRKGDTFVAQLPDDWKRKSDQKNASAFVKMMDFARSFFKVAQDADQMSDCDLRSSLREALEEVEPNLMSVESFYPITDPAHVAYSCWVPSTDSGVEVGMGYQSCYYERPFTVSDAGVITLGDARTEVQQVVSYEPVDGGQPEVMSSGQGDPGSNTSESLTTNNKESDMKREDVVTALSKATDCQIAAIGRILEGTTEEKKPTEAELKAAQDAEVAVRKQEVTDAVNAAVKALTFDQILALASSDVRSAITTGGAEAAAKKTATIKTLKDSGKCVFGDEELTAMSQGDLDKLVKLADVKTVDYSAQGPRVASTGTTEVAAAPDFTERLRAARGIKK